MGARSDGRRSKSKRKRTRRAPVGGNARVSSKSIRGATERLNSVETHNSATDIISERKFEITVREANALAEVLSHEWITTKHKDTLHAMLRRIDEFLKQEAQ